MNASDHPGPDAEAWKWVLQMDAAHWGEADEADLKAWLAGDPRRAGALLEAEAMWEALGNAVVRGQGEEPTLGSESVDVPTGPSVKRRRFLAIGAMAIAASFAGAIFIFGSPERYQTQIGEIRRIPLADGSTAAINTASRLEVVLADTQRRVRLEEGEAWFQVAKDEARPFVVEAGRIRIEAIGTAFSVHRLESGADVLVTEGTVEAWANGAEGNKIRLTAGQRAFVADNAGIVKASATAESVDRALAWRRGNVDFVNQPISEAATEFNRYNRRQIIILDVSLGREKFDGVFRIDDPEGFANAVSVSLGVPINLRDREKIVIGHQ